MTTFGEVATWLGRVWAVVLIAFAVWVLADATLRSVRRRRDVRRARALGRGLGVHRAHGYPRSRV